MKRKFFRNARYSAIVIAGALLAATPMTVLAEKNADATQTEAAVEAGDTQTEGEKSSDATDDADTKDSTDTKDNTDAGKDTTGDSTADKTSEDKTATDETESTDKETETSADETETTEAETEQETTEAETSAEETTADETEAETSAEETTAIETTAETTAVETTAAETTTVAETTAAQLKEKTLAQLLIGTWKADETTSLTFGESGKGKMSLCKEDYTFTYTLTEDQLHLDFASSKVIDCSYTVSVTEDTLTLVGGVGTTGGTFDLTRNAE